MAKWRRGGGGRRGRWVIEFVERQENGQWSTVNGQLPTAEEEPTPEAITPGVTETEPDPFEHDDPAEIRAALARLEAKRVFGDGHRTSELCLQKIC